MSLDWICVYKWIGKEKYFLLTSGELKIKFECLQSGIAELEMLSG